MKNLYTYITEGIFGGKESAKQGHLASVATLNEHFCVFRQSSEKKKNAFKTVLKKYFKQPLPTVEASMSAPLNDEKCDVQKYSTLDFDYFKALVLNTRIGELYELKHTDFCKALATRLEETFNEFYNEEWKDTIVNCGHNGFKQTHLLSFDCHPQIFDDGVRAIYVGVYAHDGDFFDRNHNNRLLGYFVLVNKPVK